jgi:hypothetical protein
MNSRREAAKVHWTVPNLLTRPGQGVPGIVS